MLLFLMNTPVQAKSAQYVGIFAACQIQGELFFDKESDEYAD